MKGILEKIRDGDNIFFNKLNINSKRDITQYISKEGLEQFKRFIELWKNK